MAPDATPDVHKGVGRAAIVRHMRAAYAGAPDDAKWNGILDYIWSLVVIHLIEPNMQGKFDSLYQSNMRGDGRASPRQWK